MEDRKPHLVALALSGEGHVTPMMHLCGFLSAIHNFSITFALLNGNSSFQLDSILRKKSWPPPQTDISLVEIQGPPYQRKQRAYFVWRKIDLTSFQEHLRVSFAQPLKRFLQELQSVDCLVCDYQLSWAIDAAKELGIPGAILFTGSVTWSWFESNMPRLVSTGAVPMDDELAEDEDYHVLEEPIKLRRSDIPWHFWNDRGWQEHTIQNNADAFARARWVLVSSCEELEPEITGAMKQAVGGDKFLPVGPLFLLGDRPENVGFTSFDPRCIPWLDQQPEKSVVYIAFGSIAELSTEQLVEFGEGLVASKQKFLWVARESEDGKANEFYERFRDKNREQGFITAWAPQTRVLSHSSVGAFVSHCGWNSTLESVSSGQVVLCWPCLFDQNLNRRLVVEDWRVGFGFERSLGKVDRKEVERVIRLAMEEEQGREARQRVKELSSKMKGAVTVPGGVSRRNLEKFVQAIATSSSTRV